MRVLISGAGVAGPALAWYLSKIGATVTIVEKSPEILAIGQNIDVNGSALQLIKKMGLLPELRRLNTQEIGTQFVNAKGKPCAVFSVKDSLFSMTAEFEVLRGSLAMLLYNATKDLPGVTYHLGTTVREVISNDSSSVKVELSNGSREEYDLLIAADGQWSRLRKEIFPQSDITVVDKDMFAVYFTIPRLSGDNNFWNIYWALEKRIVTIRPDPFGTMRVCLTLMPSNDAQRKEWQEVARSGDRLAQNKLVRKSFANAGWQVQRFLEEMERAPDFYFQSIQQIRMAKWYNERVVCLGDTAYAPTPLTGAGANLAILGAYVLTGELSKLAAGEHPERALKAYDVTFRPFVDETQDVPTFIPGLAHPQTSFGRAVRRTLIRTLGAIANNQWVVKRYKRVEEDSVDFALPEYGVFGFEDEKKIE
jgi:2-polyprenyl-6-methoxyphenol hydroxylase-like FAD-dependent oxidoreductase